MKVSYASDSNDDCVDVEQDSFEQCPSSSKCEESGDNVSGEILQSGLCDDSEPRAENSFLQQCMAELLENKFLESLMIKLDEHSHLNDFMMLLKLLQSAEFLMDNIVFLLLLE